MATVRHGIRMVGLYQLMMVDGEFSELINDR